MAEKFKFTPIEGMLTLEEATATLVSVAQCVQRTHNNDSAKSSREMMLHLFKLRKASITVLMDLIEQYINQMPEDNQEAGTCGICNDIMECSNGKHLCGNPIVYLNHDDNTQHVTPNTPACGVFSRQKGK